MQTPFAINYFMFFPKLSAERAAPPAFLLSTAIISYIVNTIVSDKFFYLLSKLIFKYGTFDKHDTYQIC